MKNAAFYIDHLQLQPHPEGGYYAETYRSSGGIPASALSQLKGGRNYSTAIYYLLEQGDHSAFHRIKSDCSGSSPAASCRHHNNKNPQDCPFC